MAFRVEPQAQLAAVLHVPVHACPGSCQLLQERNIGTFACLTDVVEKIAQIACSLAAWVLYQPHQTTARCPGAQDFSCGLD